MVDPFIGAAGWSSISTVVSLFRECLVIGKYERKREENVKKKKKGKVTSKGKNKQIINLKI